MKASVRIIENGIAGKLEGMLTRAQEVAQLWTRSIRPMYKKYQAERWVTENWGAWEPLNGDYAIWKLQQGEVRRQGEKRKTWRPVLKGGAAMMVLTGDLSKSVTLTSGKYSREMVTNSSVEVFTTVPYAKYADKARTFTKYSREFKQKVAKKIAKFIARGKE